MATAKRKTTSVKKTADAPRFHVVGNDEPPARPGGLNLGSLKKSSAKSATDKHPIVTVGTEAMELLAQFVELSPEFKRLDALVGSKGSVKAQLAPHIKQTYFARFAGAPADSTMLVDVGGKMVKLVTKNRYSTKCTDIASLGAAAGHFRIATVVKIDMAAIPAEKQQPLVDAILAAAEKYRIEEGIEYTECVQPNAGFHEARTTLFTPEQNIDIDAAIPLTVYPQL